jgi:DNA-binding NtrC family response regulator
MAHVLVIDDDTNIRQAVRRTLLAGGLSVIEAENGAVGLAQLAQNHVDLVLTDIIMPGTEGVETIQQVRRLRPVMKIIAMSGSHARNLYLDAASKLGAHAILAKPFRGKELRDAVDRVLAEPIPSQTG